MEGISKYFKYCMAACCGLVTLGSCSQEVINEDLTASERQMTIMTRGEGEPITSSVRLYVFDSEDCVAVETLDEGVSSFTKNLPAGSYEVYALAGVDDTRYDLPSKEKATKTTVITLKDGQQLGDLMAGYSSVTLSDGGNNSTTLNLSRKVILIKSITIKDVPEGTTSVHVKIGPIQESMLLNGTYQGEEGEFTTALTKQSDGTTWKMETEDIYLLPSVGKPTITVTVGTTPFSYTCQSELDANHKVTIEGSYKEPTALPAELTLSGTINGVSWGADSGLAFEFGPSEEPTTPSVEIPTEGSMYLGCYVLKVNGNEVTLLSPSEEKTTDINANDTEEHKKELLDTRINSWSVSGISSKWRLPTLSEIQLVYNASTQLSMAGGKVYTCLDGTKLKGYKISSTSFEILDASKIKLDSYLRPVTTITIQ